MAKQKRVQRKAPPTGTLLMQMLIGKWVSQAIGVAVEMGLPDQLAKGPRPVNELARAAQASEDGVYRLLRALASVGIFAEMSGRKFKLTPMGRLLCPNSKEAHGGYARFVAHDSTWRPWGELAYSVRTGQPAFDKVFGMPVFEYFAKTPDAAAIFDAAMTSLSTMESAALAAAYDFKGIRTLMDVAGGHGLLLATVLKRHRQMRGILFDMPHVTAGATALLTKQGVAGRCTIASGDFFAALPSGADAIIMKHIIHDWDDQSATRILRGCHQALGPKGKLLIAEAVVPPGNAPHFGKLLDLEMLVLTPRGRERTQPEYGALLKGAGFRLVRVVSTHAPISLVEATRA